MPCYRNPRGFRRPQIPIVFLDIYKAFDKVWNEGLIFKLKQNGISGNLLKFFEIYLQNRKQRVVLNGFYSDYSVIESGVPQGSVLGPLLFLIYINNLGRNIKSYINFLADDTMLFSIVKDPVIPAYDLNHDLNNINQWEHQWKMVFNPDATKQTTELLFSCKQLPHFMFNWTAVTKVNEQSHLSPFLNQTYPLIKILMKKMLKAEKDILNFYL